MNAQISFIDGQFSLIRIPLEHYSCLLKPILQVLLPHSIPDEDGTVSDDQKHSFFNLSITPIECSVICRTVWTKRVFEPAIARLPSEVQKEVSISRDSYMVFSVSSAGMEAGQRVIDLTAPLALAGISIFFITTYYTDFILVPTKDHQSVVQALLERGFEFSESDAAFVTPSPSTHSRAPSLTEPPRTPPPANIAELQQRTFALLKKRNIVPFIEPGLHLVQCSGKDLTTTTDEFARRPSNGNGSNGHQQSSWLDSVDSKLYVGLVSTLSQQPRFLSFTLSQDDAPSLLIDKALLCMFGDSIDGDTDGVLVPIFLDLLPLPLESTGIVCGVAGKLADEIRMGQQEESELSYLSTARAGSVILSLGWSEKALGALTPLL